MNRSIAALSITLTMAAACVLTALVSGCSPSKPIVLGFSQSGDEGPWRTANSDSIKAAAGKAGIDLRFVDARGQEEQIAALRSFIAAHVDVIAFTPAAETGWDAVLSEAKRAAIPVVLTERAIEVSDRSLYTTLLGSDFVEQGRNAARWLLENTLGRSGETLIVEVRGTEGSLLTRDRGRGFHEIIDTDPHFQIVRSQAGDFTRTGGRSAMKEMLTAEGRRIEVVFAHNDEMALGAIQAIEDARLRPGKDITVISVDGMRSAFEAMVAGKLNVTVESNPLIGPQLMGVAQDLVAHRRLPHRLLVDESVFPMESAQEALPVRKY